LMEPRGIFISYRREQNAAHAGRLYDRLSDAFGEQATFMDVDSIGLGLDFARVLDEAVSSCSVMLVLIGPGWAQLAEHGGRRLDDPDDYVRQEVERACGGRSVPSRCWCTAPPCQRRRSFPRACGHWYAARRSCCRRGVPLPGAGAGG
jgi:TIR domain